jgi:hypothetical protein
VMRDSSTSSLAADSSEGSMHCEVVHRISLVRKVAGLSDTRELWRYLACTWRRRASQRCERVASGGRKFASWRGAVKSIAIVDKDAVCEYEGIYSSPPQDHVDSRGSASDAGLNRQCTK